MAIERTLTFKSVHAASHITVYANVLSGYIGPRGDLILDFGFDAVPPPQEEVVRVNEAGEIVPNPREDGAASVDVDREYRVRVVMPGQHAKSLAQWFEQRAAEVANPQEAPSGASGD
jgi:hypothetical protein